MTEKFYPAFEEKFRGSRDLVKSRLRVYLPFVQPLLAEDLSVRVIDLGCGRGEWLELLSENGFDAQGVDLDDGMLAACRERGLSVHTGDALEFLCIQPDQSQSVVSGFHIAEHLSFEKLQALVAQALRVLVPGGLLILETPNPENLVTGTSSFYLDPTHLKPIPPQLLAFLTEYVGFKRNKILRLQESIKIDSHHEITLLDVLSGVSPDFAIVAQKDGPENRIAELQQAFDTDFGLTLEALANMYQERIGAKIDQAEARAQQAEAMAQHAAEALQAIYSSTSWRITEPLRRLKKFITR